jgi:uncharacterized protein (TIGR02145 family)
MEQYGWTIFIYRDTHGSREDDHHSSPPWPRRGGMAIEVMAENLRTTKYNDGSPISNITSRTTWDSCIYTQMGAYCYYDNATNSDSIKNFGALYNWYSVNTGKLAPAGWHVPTSAEWDTLRNYLIANGYNYDGTTTENKIAQSMAAKTDWESSKVDGAVGKDLTKNNRSGFSGLPGGFRSNAGTFDARRERGSWWSATEDFTKIAKYRFLGCDLTNLYGNDPEYMSCGFSVRLVRDN